MEIPERATTEQQFAKKAGRLTESQRKRLQSLLGSPPDPANVPESFWQEVQEETERMLLAMLFFVFLASANFHAGGKSSGSGLTILQQTLIDQQAGDYARQRSSAVAERYTITSRKRFATLARKLEEALADPDKPRMTKAETAKGTAKVFGPSRASEISITETTAAQSSGGEAGVKLTFGVSLDDLWITEKDQRVCPICRPLHNTKRKTWGLEFFSGPPAHPSCRCYIKYVNKGSPV